jgi:hypothetical protein
MTSNDIDKTVNDIVKNLIDIDKTANGIVRTFNEGDKTFNDITKTLNDSGMNALRYGAETKQEGA